MQHFLIILHLFYVTTITELYNHTILINLRRMNKKLILGACLGLLFASCSTDKFEREIALVPQVKEMSPVRGVYTIKATTPVGYAQPDLLPAAELVSEMINRSTGWDIKPVNGTIQGINLSVDSMMPEKNGYTLSIDKESVEIIGQSYEGVISGIQTLRQLLPPAIELEKGLSRHNQITLPIIDIKDNPTYQWRGMMLDVSRHFYSVEEVKELLDWMSLYKMNKFHWHLTDDQGWRIEIKQYPLLTEKGAWRKFNSHDKSCLYYARHEDNPDFNIPEEHLKVVAGDTLYGGYYTQEQIKDVVSYASKLGIDVIPEIDMPGHFSAAIANYPNISCFNQAGWGNVFSAPICPGKDEVIEFCQNVYDEIMPLFPYEYYHLGADEVEKINWKKCPNCQKRIKDQGLKNEEELQSWFVHQMEDYLNSKGKKLIGWDEIIEGGLSETSTIMWWRSWVKDAVNQAAENGNESILTPNEYFYFDYRPDAGTLSKVYNFNPELDGLTPEQKGLIKGVQANVWCEWIPSQERLAYMIFPRMTATAEIGWGKKPGADFEDYKKRLMPHYDRWDLMSVNYRMPDLTGFHATNVFTDSAKVDVKCDFPHAVIRYTTNGRIPDENSLKYEGPISIDTTTHFIFRTFRPNGSKDEFVHTSYVKQSPAASSDVSKENMKQGLNLKSYEKQYKNCEDFTKGAKLLTDSNVDTIAIPEGASGHLGLMFTGYIEIPSDGIYTFKLLSDDGSRLYINDYLVIDNDGPHAPKEVVGQYAMKKGLHPLTLYYFDGNNGGSLKLQVLSPEGKELNDIFLN